MQFLTRRRLLAGAAMLLTMLPQASTADTAKRRTNVSEVWVRTELYFGTNKPDGQVTDAEFSAFVDSQVTRLFPDGLTLLTGYGQFKNSNGIIVREKSFLLILLYSPQMHDSNKKVEELRELYKTAHGQESVLRVDSYSFVSF